MFKLIALLTLPSLFALGSLAVGCNDDRKDAPKPAAGAQYGDPVGIEIDAHGPVPPLEVKVAVTKGRDPAPSVSSLAGAVYAAASGCPTFLAAMTAGKVTRIELSARNNAFTSLGAAPDEVGGVCMSAALNGKPAKMDQPEPLDIILELKRRASDAAH